jgi:hypothetical protein
MTDKSPRFTRATFADVGQMFDQPSPCPPIRTVGGKAGFGDQIGDMLPNI